MKDERLRESIIKYLENAIKNCWRMGEFEVERGNDESADMWMWSRNAYEHVLHTLKLPNFYKDE